MMTWLWAIVAFGILVFVHELGHFLVAKRAGIGVTVFSLGFGPKILWYKWGGTEYRVSAIPLGGYVRMVGENPADEVAPEDEDVSFAHKSVWWRLAAVAAGPLSNVVFAVFAFFVLAFFWGSPIGPSARVGGVVAKSPAAAAKLHKDDLILSVNGRAVKTFMDLKREVVQSQGKPLGLIVARGQDKVAVTLTPQKAEYKDAAGVAKTEYRIGIMISQEVLFEPVGAGSAVVQALEQTYAAGAMIFKTVGRLVTRKASMNEVGGPIMIAQAAEKAASRGAEHLIFLLGVISINLAILNLLPIPVLDGGHILFFLIEAVTGRPVPMSAREKAQQVGVLVLVALMAVVFYNDIARMITAG